MNFEPLIYFDFKIKGSELNKKFGSNKYTETAEDTSLGRTADAIYNILILYKELNPMYRRLLKSDIVESAVYSNNNIINVLKNEAIINGNKEVSRFRYDLITTNAMNFIRFIDDTPFLIKDFRDLSTNKVYKTTKLFKYLYTNPYIVRSASESEVISYYIESTTSGYLMNGYGRFEYQKEEIYNFLKIF